VNDLDFEKADLLVTMDNFNFSELSKLAPNDEQKNKIIPFCDFVSSSESEVPDPYYGGASGFEKVLDLLEDGCVSLLEYAKQKLP
jgi:protein-tyrosine phosphatase